MQIHKTQHHNNMKRTATFLTMLVIACALHAQPVAVSNNYDTGFGIQFGYINARPQSRIGSTEEYTTGTPLNGFKVGLVHELNFYKGLGMVYGLNYSYLGRRTSWETDDTYNNIQTREGETAHRLDIPVNLQYKVTIARKTYFIMHAGPDFDYCLSHTQTTFTRSTNQSVSLNDKYTTNLLETDEDSDGVTDNSPFNVLLNIGLGFQFHNAQIKGGYSFGIFNTQNDRYYNTQSKYWYSRQNEWNIRLVYIF